MKVVVQGTKEFDDYNVFLRSMAVALSSLKGDENNIEFYSVGPNKINNFLAGFVNLSEDGMRNRGMKIAFYRVPHRWVESNIDSIDYFVYLSKPKEGYSSLVYQAEEHDVEVGVFRY